MTKKKSIVILLFLVALLSVTVVANASVKYPYGPYQYGEKNVWIWGNLSPSGVGKNGRPSIVYRNDVRVQNAITGEISPYFQTVQFDIQEYLPTDDFKDRRGYHLIPLDEDLIRDLTAKANGNADFVWNEISKNPSNPVVQKYIIDGETWVNFGAVFNLSGGGAPTLTRPE